MYANTQLHMTHFQYTLMFPLVECFFKSLIEKMFLSGLRFLEGDEDEDTCMISQEDIAEAVDITSGAKVRTLKVLDNFTFDIHLLRFFLLLLFFL